MKLFEEMISDCFSLSQQNHIGFQRPRFEKLIVDSSSDKYLSPITQFFLAPFIFIDTNGVLHIPVGETFIYDQVVKEIAPHFEEVRTIKVGDQVQFMLQSVRESSKEKFNNLLLEKKINGIVEDLYADKNITSWEKEFQIKQYKVNLEFIPRSLEHNIESMWKFFKHTFIQVNGELVLLPNGWLFDDTFKDRISIQTLAAVCSSMRVLVDSNRNTITSILVH